MTTASADLVRPATAWSIDASDGVAQIDISQPLPGLAGIGPLGVRCLVRLGAEPLGFVDVVGPQRLGADALAAAIWGELAAEIMPKCGSTGPTAAQPLTPTGVDQSPGLSDGSANPHASAVVEPSVTVVIATHDRPTLLDRCLTSLVAARPAPGQIIVVDNAPSTDQTRVLVERWTQTHPEIRYVLEPRAGLGRAHNAALPFLEGSHVAFTDDDVRVDPHWVGALVRGFETTPATVCVTGLIAPAELVTQEQWWIERGSGFAKGFSPRVRSLGRRDREGPLFPFDAGTLGSGANMAFTRSYLVGRGGFDATLGTGTRSLGGDDLAALHEVVAAGHDLVYQPAAIVFHRHHADRPALHRQAMGYGAGLTAYLTSVIVRRPGAALDLARRARPGLRQIFSSSSPLSQRRSSDYPAALVWRERAGMAAGPVRYAWQRAVDGRSARREPAR